MAEETLSAEYERMMRNFSKIPPEPDTGSPIYAMAHAIRHILMRLGPPEPLDGVAAEKLTDASD